MPTWLVTPMVTLLLFKPKHQFLRRVFFAVVAFSLINVHARDNWASELYITPEILLLMMTIMINEERLGRVAETRTQKLFMTSTFVISALLLYLVGKTFMPTSLLVKMILEFIILIIPTVAVGRLINTSK